MQPGANPIEGYKAAIGGDGLLIRDRLPGLIEKGWEKLEGNEKELLKWIGVFLRKPTPGRFMMRIRMPNGFGTAKQLRAIADLSRRMGNGVLDITTRQQLELRGYTLSDVPEIMKTLDGIDLTSLQTGMDNVRNINGCALSGLANDEWLDASKAVFALDGILVGRDGNPEFTNLPRKMNVTISGCLHNCTHNESQDIALVPAEKDGTRGFNVLIGGKMGSGGFTIAKPLDVFVNLNDAATLCAEIVRMFRDHGERGPRAKCRLAFLIEAWGTSKFRNELQTRMGVELKPAGKDVRSNQHADHLGQTTQHDGKVSIGLAIPTGRLDPDGVDGLADLAEKYGTGRIRLSVAQDAFIPDVPKEKIEQFMREPVVKKHTPTPSPFFRKMVACTGTDFCNLAQIETKSAAVKLSHELDKRLGPNHEPVSIHWSGCPAACGNHQAADIGLRGMKVNVDGKVVDAVAVYVGGRTGPQAKQGHLILDMVPLDEVLPDVLVQVLGNMALFDQVERDPLAKDRVLMIPAGLPGGVEIPWKGEEEA